MKPQTRVSILEIPYLPQEEKSYDSGINKGNQKSPPNRPIPRTLPRPPPRPLRHKEKEKSKAQSPKDQNRSESILPTHNRNIRKNGYSRQRIV